eukprot:CAMPEP_0118660228 /NCGR_PEP_ID=MMETSP0785-20121206/15558_1 /TAXON_ID=91992 /ORGANISM="Bolidomonas pacifica, Strain CCMP 1866" /LENGTH=1050 /DNA_ID=CAMNT_0006553435 /DNA_START=177 /DNA_END=3329 /DNA_ORIENTATION=-
MTDAPSLQIVLEENRRMAEEMKQLKQMLAGKKGAKKNGFDEVKKEMGGEVRENEKKTEEDRKHAGGQVPHKVEVKKEKAGGKSANSQGSVYRPLEDGGGRKLADCYPDLDSFFSAPPPKRGWYDNGYKATSRSIFPRGMGPKIDRAHVFSPAELAILGLPPGSNKSNLLNPSYRGYDPKIAAAIRKLKVTGREPTQVGHNNKNSGSSSNNNIQRPLPNIKSPENPLIAMSIPNTSSPHSPRSPRTPSDPALMTFGYNPTFNQKKPPFGYICKICKIPGHYVQACPRIATDMASYGPSVNGAPVSSGNDPNGNNSNMGRYRPSSSEMLNGPGMNGPGPIGLNGGGQSRPPNRILNPNYGGGGARGIPYQNNAQNTHGDYDRGARGEKAIGERITKDEEYKKSHMLMVFSIGINFHGDNRDVTNLGPREKEELVKRMLIEMLTYCDVAITRVIVNTNRGGNNIFAFIHCLDESEANKCIRKCFGMNFGGRRFLCKYQQPRFEDDWGSKHVPNWDDVINRKEIEAGRFAKRLRKEEREASRRVKSPTNSTGVQSTRKSSPKRVDGMTESQRRKLEAFLDKLYPDRHKVKEEKEEKEVEEEAEEIEKVEEIENVEEIEKTEEEEKGAKGKRKAAASARAKKNNNKKKAKPIMASMVVIDSEEDDDEERRPRSPKIGQRVKHLIRGWGIVASGVRKGGWVDFEFDDSSTLKALRMSDRNLVFDEEEKEEEEKEEEGTSKGVGDTMLLSAVEKSKMIGSIVLIESTARDAIPATYVVKRVDRSWVKLEDKYGKEVTKSYRPNQLVLIGNQADDEEEEGLKSEFDDSDSEANSENSDYGGGGGRRGKGSKCDQSHWVRRSARQPGEEALSHPSVLELLERLTLDDESLAILKLKKFIGMDTSPLVIDAILDALMFNTSVQALYIQNFNYGMKDTQVFKLIEVLKRGFIWTLNIGETYNVRPDTWAYFAQELIHTNVTHMYASEHTISGKCKLNIMESMRVNRKKHDMHCNPENLDVIKGVTHCWWNPINAKVLRPYLKDSDKALLGVDKTKTAKDLD